MGIMDKIKSRDINFGSVEDKKDEVKGQETSLTKTNTSTIVQRDLDTSGILKVQTNLDLLNIDFDFLDEYVDEETKNKIKIKTQQLKIKEMETRIIIGQFLEDIFQLTKHSRKGDCFETWCAKVGFKTRKTADRYRQYANLYNAIANENNKSLVGTLGFREVEKALRLLKDDNQIFEKNVFYSAEEIKEFIIRNRIALEDKTEKTVKVLDIERRDFTTIYSTLEDEWEELGDKEKNKINQYLEKINDILLKREEDNNIQEAEVVK